MTSTDLLCELTSSSTHRGIVEPVHHLLPLLDGHGAVQTHVRVVAEAAQLLKHIQSLGVVGDQHHLVVCSSTCHCQQTVQDTHLAWGYYTIKLRVQVYVCML